MNSLNPLPTLLSIIGSSEHRHRRPSLATLDGVSSLRREGSGVRVSILEFPWGIWRVGK